MNQDKNNNNTSNQDVEVGDSKSNKTIIIVIGVIVVTIVLYMMFFKKKEDSEEKEDNDALVIENNAETPISNTRDLEGYDSGLIDVDLPTNDVFDTPKTDSTIPSLPEIPALPDNIKQQIASSVKKEDTYTKEQVDSMINAKMKEMMEQQMQMMSKINQSNNTNNTSSTTTKTEYIYVPNQDSIEITPENQNSEIRVTKSPKKKNKKKSTKNTNIQGDNLEEEIDEEDELEEDELEDELGLNTVNNEGKKMTEEEILKQKQREEQDTLERNNRRQALQERKAAPLFKINSGSGPTNSTIQDDDAIVLTYTTQAVKLEEKTPDVRATRTTDLTKVIMQGKIIDAILETAIDTGLSATVRAIITRDVYAEEGKNILIPRGSRIIGSYVSDIKTGQTRVTINWNRIIRVDGMSLNISSIGTDRLGRAGVPGELDNRYVQRLANSFLASVLTVGSSILAEKINDSAGITSTVSSLTGETTSTTGKASDYALVDATEDFMQEAQDIVDEIAQQKPVVRIPQGEKLTIMVTQDITLPVFKKGL